MQISLSTAFLGALSALAGPSAASSSSSSSNKPHHQPQTTITLWIPSSQTLPNPHILPPTTHATLSALRRAYDAPLTAAGSFVFRNVTPGSYLADVHSATHAFAPLRIDVLPHTPADDGDARGGEGEGEEGEGGLVVRAWETYRGNDWDNKGQEVPRSGGGFAVRALGPKEYFVERGSCEYSVLLLFSRLPPIFYSYCCCWRISCGMASYLASWPKPREQNDKRRRKEKQRGTNHICC